MKSNETVTETEIKTAPIIEVATTTPINPETYLRRKSTEYGLNPDMVVKIAKCESSLKPNAVSPTHDYGLLQVNRKVHNGSMQERGLSIYKWEDSTAYGLELMQKEGVRPWRASAHCHGYY